MIRRKIAVVLAAVAATLGMVVAVPSSASANFQGCEDFNLGLTWGGRACLDVFYDGDRVSMFSASSESIGGTHHAELSQEQPSKWVVANSAAKPAYQKSQVWYSPSWAITDGKYCATTWEHAIAGGYRWREDVCFWV
ncbi:hypothetical protein [Streptomyces sp. NPDC000410]|uniref:hypothetical protein n=1 Tax=Streptomyces sp. NPDC000410 TaxID=3154254 RepID=UPI00332BF453